MFGWFKKREKPRLMVVGGNDYTAAKEARDREMRHQQTMIQYELGFEPGDDVQSWLRLHQILKDHDDRLKALEGKK